MLKYSLKLWANNDMLKQNYCYWSWLICIAKIQMKKKLERLFNGLLIGLTQFQKLLLIDCAYACNLFYALYISMF